MKKLIALVVFQLLAITVFAGFLPVVGTGTSPNQWTSNVEGVLREAQKTGYPIFVLIINDSNDGVGCSHCATFLSKTINTSEFEALKRSNTFYMVLMNYWSGANGSRGNIDTYHFRWRTASTAAIYKNSDVLPDIAVIDPYTGAKAQGWGVPWGDSGNRTAKIKEVLDRYVPHISEFGISAVSSSPVISGSGSWNGHVSRSGASGLAGTATVSLSGTHAQYYTVSQSEFSWGTGDGVFDFTVTGPSSVVDPVLYDELQVTVNGACDGAEIRYSTQTINLVFRDGRIKKTLPEFRAEHDGLGGLTASKGVWFVSTEDTPFALETVMKDEAVLAFTATKPGKLALAIPASLPETTACSVTSSSEGADDINLTEQVKTIGVSAGDTVEIRFTNKGDAVSVGLSELSFKPLEVQLATPVNGAAIGWPNVRDDPSLVDFSWSSNVENPDYDLYLSQNGMDHVFDGKSVNIGEQTSRNGVDAGLVDTSVVMGDCYWGVRVRDSSADYGCAYAFATAAFSITAKPEYASASQSVVGYLKSGTAFNFAAYVPEGTGEVTYSAKGMPAGLRIDSRTGQVSGTPKKSGTYKFTVTASNAYGTASKSVELAVLKFPSSLKGNFNGVFFAGKTIPHSMSWKVAASGKWNGKLLASLGSSVSIKGTVVIDQDGTVILDSPQLAIRQKPGTDLWTGSWGGATLYGKKTGKIDSSFVGIWNTGAKSSAIPALGAYAVSKVTASGKVSISGKANAKQKFSAKGQALMLTGWEIATYIPEWANNGESAVFVHGCKKTSGKLFCGGFAFWQGHSCEGVFELAGQPYDNCSGSFWNKNEKISSLSGASFVAEGDFGAVAFRVTATDRKLSAEPNACSAKITAKSAKGLVSGSFKAGDATYKYEGTLMMTPEGKAMAFGGASSGEHTGAFVIE